MAAESLQGLPYPLSSSAADVPADISALALAVAPKTVMTFASAAARTSAFTAAGVSPAAGMISYRTDGGINGYEYYNATAGQWRVLGRYKDSSTLGATAAAVTFPSIPTYLRTLNLTVNARSDTAAAFTNVDIRVGGDTGPQYRNVVKFYQAGVYGTPVVQSGTTSARIGYINANTTAAGLYGVIRLDLVGWDGPKAGALRGISQSGYYDSTSGYVLAEASVDYAGSAAYTSLTVLCGAGNFAAGSEFVLSGNE